MSEQYFVFTVHKAASTFLANACSAMADVLQTELHSPNKNRNLPEVPGGLQAEHVENRVGVFGPIRMPCKYNVLQGASAVVHLRDPRDVLTSLYYSQAYSHVGIKDDIRENLIDIGIDQFVLDQHHIFLNRYNRYLKMLIGRPRITLLYYEDFMETPEKWVAQFCLGLMWRSPVETRTMLQRTINDLIHQNKAPEAEDKSKHIRQAKPGDHERKLKPETIDKLNDAFRDVLYQLGYVS